MFSLPSRRGPRVAALLLAASAGAALATAQSASAADHCVGVTPGCTGVDYAFTAAGFASALSTSAGSVEADRIVVAKGTIASTTGFTYASASPLDILGAGRDQSIISWSGAVGTGLSLSGSGAPSIHDLGLTIGNVTTAQPRGISAAGAVKLTRLAINETSSVDNAVIVGLTDGAQLIDSAVVANSPGDTSVVMNNTTADILGSTISAGGGSAVRTSTSSLHLVARTKITNARTGIAIDAGSIVVRDSVFDLGAGAKRTAIFGGNYNNGQKPITVTSLRNTIVGNGIDQTGILVMADSSGETTTGTVTDTVVSLLGAGSADLTCMQANAGNASLAVETSAYAVLGHTGSCMPTTADWVNTATTPLGLVDRAAGDLRPAASSPLIDAGSSSADAAGLDLLGTARLLDGDADGAAKVDIGALEYAAPAPVQQGPGSGDPAEAQPQSGDDPTPTPKPGTGEPETPATTPLLAPGPTPTSTPRPTVPGPTPTVAISATAKAASLRGKTGFTLAGKAARRTFTVRLAGAASIELSVAKLSKGRLIAGNGPAKCVRGTGTPRCTLTTPIAGRTIVPVSGRTSAVIAFGGRLNGKTLKAGTYRVTVTPLSGWTRGKAVTTTIKVA